MITPIRSTDCIDRRMSYSLTYYTWNKMPDGHYRWRDSGIGLAPWVDENFVVLAVLGPPPGLFTFQAIA